MQKTNENKVTIIGGCGHVGLPLGIILANSEFNVHLIDKDIEKVNIVNDGRLPFIEEGAEVLLKKALDNSLIRASLNKEFIKDSQFVIFVTATPIDDHMNPKVSEILSVFDEYIHDIADDAIIIFRSTNYPGVFDLLESRLFKIKRTKNIAFCPERILQGKAIKEIKSLPQIISSNDQNVIKKVERFFMTFCQKVIKLTPKEAEFSKLMTNSWRYIQFSIANQFYMMAQESDLDFMKIYEAVKDDYPRANSFSSPGLTAGPCLFKDTMQLSSFSDNNFFIGHAAMLINEGMPRFLIKMLKTKIGSLKNKKVAILGMTFKPNCDDTRDSLSYKIKKELELNEATSIESDIYLKESLQTEEALDQADAIILAIPHKEYLNIKTKKPFIDCWGVWKSE